MGKCREFHFQRGTLTFPKETRLGHREGTPVTQEEHWFLNAVVMMDTPSFSPINALNAIGYIPVELKI